MLSQNKSSIMKFVSFLKELDKNYNLIFRPHPKLKYTSQISLNYLKTLNLN